MDTNEVYILNRIKENSFTVEAKHINIVDFFNGSYTKKITFR